MAIYSKKYYIKGKNGRWKLQSSSTERCFSEFGRWKRSCEMEQGTGDHSFLDVENTRGGLNKKVVRVRTYFADGTKCVRKLITTSNKLPRNKE